MSYENELDKYLKIKTTGRDDSNYDFINFPYEATPYEILEGLANSGYIMKKDKLIDYGCGKGRVSFYLAHYTKAKFIGVELDNRLYQKACENKVTALSRNKVEFTQMNAVDFVFPIDVNGAYFFNPFSVDILKKVINQIIESQLKVKREIMLYFYYPSVEYLAFLNSLPQVKFIDNLCFYDVMNNDDEREYIAVYKLA